MNSTSKTSGSSPWIRWIGDEEASGPLKRMYDAAIARAGKVWNIVRIMSLRPRALETSLGLYASVCHAASEMLGRAEREMIAVTVSRLNHCHY